MITFMFLSILVALIVPILSGLIATVLDVVICIMLVIALWRIMTKEVMN